MPSRPGILRSVSTSAMSSWASRSRAAEPSLTTTTLYPSAERTASSGVVTAGSSSAIRIVLLAMGCVIGQAIGGN